LLVDSIESMMMHGLANPNNPNACVQTLMKLRVPNNVGYFFSSWETTSFSTRPFYQ